VNISQDYIILKVIFCKDTKLKHLETKKERKNHHIVQQGLHFIGQWKHISTGFWNNGKSKLYDQKKFMIITHYIH